MIPNGTRFIGIAPEVDLTERGSALLNKRTEPYTIDDIRGYKVFTALLTQSGGNVEDQIDNGGHVTKGVTYTIYNAVDADFSNVGAPNSNDGTSFIAINDEEPISFGTAGAALAFNTGAPVVNVLENTIGNVWFIYGEPGIYSVNSNNLFSPNKTYFQKVVMSSATILNNIINSSDLIEISPTDGDDMLLNTPIEIRVYN